MVPDGTGTGNVYTNTGDESYSTTIVNSEWWALT